MDVSHGERESASLRQKRHYCKIAEEYDGVRKGLPFTRQYNRHLDELMLARLPRDPAARVLDAFCGSGDLLPALRSRFRSVVGLDISEEMLRRIDARACGVVPRVCGDALSLPFRDGAFDAVAIRGGLHHAPDHRRVLSELRRVLREGGVLVAHEPCDDNRLVRAVRRCIYRISPMLDEQTEHGFRSVEMESYLKECGFRAVRIDGYGAAGYALCANPDVLKFTKGLRLLPGIDLLTRGLIALDDRVAGVRALRAVNLTLLAVAVK